MLVLINVMVGRRINIITIYFSFRFKISYYDGLLFKASRIIISKKLRKAILDKLHVSHLGKEKSKLIAR